MQKIRWFFLIVLLVIVLILTVQNNELTNVQFLFWEQSLPLSVLLLLSTGMGFFSGAFMTALMLRQRRKAAKKLAKESANDSPPATEDPTAG